MDLSKVEKKTLICKSFYSYLGSWFLSEYYFEI